MGDINVWEEGEIHYWEPLGAVLELPEIHGHVWARHKRSKSGGVRPPQKLLAKAKSDTIMSLLAN